ncbi:MAG: hypothetical protein PHZ02_05540 [Desulfocapsaceae bacterium]|nr:hypothetical protein [Desulfocapsaceae bacterium]
MFSRSLLTAIGVCGVFLLFHPLNTQGGELIIHDGGAVTVNTDSTLLLNCNNLTIENNGTFTLNGGAIERRGKLLLESGGLYTLISGTVDMCKFFYVIPCSDGKRTIICL